jgi:hypothetical protein
VNLPATNSPSPALGNPCCVVASQSCALIHFVEYLIWFKLKAPCVPHPNFSVLFCGRPFLQHHKELREFSSVFGEHLISMTIPLRKDEGILVYSLRESGLMPTGYYTYL